MDEMTFAVMVSACAGASSLSARLVCSKVLADGAVQSVRACSSGVASVTLAMACLCKSTLVQTLHTCRARRVRRTHGDRAQCVQSV